MHHNYIGHDYIGHNYTGDNYIGHNYTGHNSGLPWQPQRFVLCSMAALKLMRSIARVGHNYMCHNYIANALDREGAACTVHRRAPARACAHARTHARAGSSALLLASLTPGHTDVLQVGLCLHHNYIGHSYVGRSRIGHNYIGHNYIGPNYIGPNYMGHTNYIVTI